MVKVYSAYTRVPALVVQFPPVANKHKTISAIKGALEGVMRAKNIYEGFLYKEGSLGQGIA